MKPSSALRSFLLLAGSSLLAISYSHAATFIWDNSNVTGATPAASLNWFNATQGTWTGGTPVSSNTNTIQFFQNTTTALTNTGVSGNTQASVIDTVGDVAFELGTLTLNGLASATAGANLTMNISGDALNFSAATGTINLNALNATRTITYNVNSNIQLGTASSAGALTITGNGTGVFNIGGIISELQTGGGSLIKSGTSTVSLTAANSYTGATTISGGNLTLSGTGTLASTAINLNGGNLLATTSGGTFTLSNTSLASNLGNRVSDSAVITVNGNSALNFTNTAVAATDYSETIGTLSLQSGSLTYTGTQAASGRTSNLLFTNLTRTGATNTSTVNFAGTNLGVDARNTIKFTNGVTAGQDLGPWAVVNGGAFATYDATFGIKAATSSTLAVNSNSSTTNFNTTAGSITFDASLNPSLKTLLITGSPARTTAINGNTVSVGGISSTGATHIISGAGAVQALTAGDALYINVGANTLQFDSVIQNVGAGATASAVVKSGTGNLILSNANTFTGGFVSNGGLVTANNNSAFGTGPVTINGTTNMTPASVNYVYANSFALNNGAMLNFTIAGGNTNTISGAVTGTGGVGPTSAGSIEQRTISLTNTANTFTGPIMLNWDNQNHSALSVNSLSDAVGSGAINLFANASASFVWGAGAVTPLTLNNRQFVMTSSTAGANLFIKNANTTAANIITVNTDLLITGAGTKSLTLRGANTGNNTFAGKIGDGPSGALSLTKDEAGTWALTNTANSYTGATTITAGTLLVSALADGGSNSSIGASTGAGGLILNGGTLRYAGALVSTDRTLSLAASSTIDASGTGALTFSAANMMPDVNLTGTFTAASGVVTGISSTADMRVGMTVTSTAYAGTKTISSINSGSSITLNNGTGVSAGSFTVAGGTPTARTLTLTGINTGANTVAGVLQNSTAAGAGVLSIAKSGVGTWVLAGNNSYTGSTTLNAGTLKLNYDTGTGGVNDSKLSNTITTGTLLLNGGTLELSGGDHLETVVSTTLNTGGTFIKQTNSGTAKLSMGGITFTGGAIDFSAGSIATTSQANLTSNILNLRATVAGADYARNDGAGNIVALADGSYTTFAAAGTLAANTIYKLAGTGTTSAVAQSQATAGLRITTTTTGQTLALGASFTTGSILFSGAQDYAITTSGSFRINPTALLNYGAGALTLGSLGADLVQYGTGKTILNNAAGGDYGMTINGGTVQISNNLQIGNNTTVKVITLNNGTLLASENLALDANGAGSNARTITLGAGGGTLAAASTKTLTVSGVISGALNPLTIGSGSNTGTVTLTGVNTYTGTTTVNAGTLIVGVGGVGSTSGGSAVTVASGATLGGSGTIGGTLAVTGILAPGNSGIGTLNAGSTTWNGGSVWNFDLSNANNTSDKLNITGNLVKGSGSGFQFNFMGSQPVWNTTYTLATFASSVGFVLSDFSYTNLGTGSYSTSNFTLNGTSLQFTAIPEPTSALAGLLLGAGLLRRRRR